MIDDDQKTQSDKFKDAAREAGCDESEAAFEETLKKLGKHKPGPEPKAEKRTRKRPGKKTREMP